MKRQCTVTCVGQPVSGQELEKTAQAALCAVAELTEQYLKQQPIKPGGRKTGQAALTRKELMQGVQLWTHSAQQ